LSVLAHPRKPWRTSLAISQQKPGGTGQMMACGVYDSLPGKYFRIFKRVNLD
jgi:hypothetical protein